MNCESLNTHENIIGKFFLKVSVFMCSNTSFAASSGDMMNGMVKSYFLAIEVVRN